MIPLRSSERVSSTPKVTASLIAVNTAIFLYQVSLPNYASDEFALRWGIVPDHLSLITLITSMFLHGGWLHIIGNMLFLWVFGRNVEDLTGGARFFLLYMTCGVAAGILHVVTNPYSRLPTIGASGAIAGVMGAYLMKFPRSRIVTLFPIFVFFTTLEIPAVLYLVYWFAIQFFSGIGSLASQDYTGGGTAWFSHVGGFIAGLLLIRLFPDQRRWRTWHSDQ
jgi:membrane associated rhomboid family serine protease